MLSKSQYIRGLQCHKSLWLHKNSPSLKNEISEQSESLFNTGNQVGDYAKQLFPGGEEIEFNPDDFAGMIQKTTNLIKNNTSTIYEATFKEKGVFAMADILQKNGEGWDVYEVKASTTTKPYHIDDAAIQYYSLSNAITINKVFIIHINNQYVRQGELDIHALFVLDDITDQVLSRQEGVQSNLKSLEIMLKSSMPEIDIGHHCSDPYECDFSDYCWKNIPEPSVFNLYRLNWSKKFDLYYSGVRKYEELPNNYALTEIQRLQVDAAKNNKVRVNKPIVEEFLNSIEYPISFFDFETFQNAIPRFDDQRPYMQMPFQYSLHIVNDDGEMTHMEFLGNENEDPRRELSERMLNDLPGTGSIMAYNQSFEIGRIRELADLFPDLRAELLALTERFVDLITPFRNLGYYHPDFNGSFSIKSVLPAMFPDDPELDYKKLGIQDGGMAMDAFANLHLLKDTNKREQIRNDLLAYCHLDTLAMVRIWGKLNGICNEHL